MFSSTPMALCERDMTCELTKQDRYENPQAAIDSREEPGEAVHCWFCCGWHWRAARTGCCGK